MQPQQKQWSVCLVFLVGIGTILNAFLVMDGRFLIEESSGSSSLSTPHAQTTSSTTGDASTTRHILLGLSGNHTGFLGEFEVALKSILINAPLTNPLTIHVMADEEAYTMSESTILSHANLTHWRTRTPARICVYNVESYEKDWLATIGERLAVAASLTKHSLYRHTIGAYYRLFFDDALLRMNATSTDDGPLLYMDTDTVVLANLDTVWQHHAVKETNDVHEEDDKRVLFQWGDSHCSAFILLWPQRITAIWELYAQAPVSVLQKLLRSRPVVDDQFVLSVIQTQHPELVGRLGREWDISAQDGPWTPGKKQPDTKHWLLSQHRPQAGMLHFNGGGASKEAYFVSHRMYANDPLWNLAKYYVDMPWSWARFKVESQIEHGAGFAMSVDYYNNK